jgi:predicted nucleic acid-binding protein
MKSFTGSEPLFIDTWGWLVLSNDKEINHRLVVNLHRQCLDRGGAWITTDYVLDETLTRLFAANPFSKAHQFFEAILKSQKLGSLKVETISPDRFQAAWELRLRYKDKPRISFTDLTSFVVMREASIRHVLTGDAHFSQVGLRFQRIP